MFLVHTYWGFNSCLVKEFDGPDSSLVLKYNLSWQNSLESRVLMRGYVQRPPREMEIKGHLAGSVG